VTPSISPGSLRIEDCDPRSDNRRRVIDVAREAVTIRRAVAGVSMAIRVSSSAYRGVSLRVAALRDGRFQYEVTLLHRDPDLSVSLAKGCDRATIEARWRDWVRFLRLPALVGRTDANDVEVSLGLSDPAGRKPSLRRRGRATLWRRPRFLTRRKVGGLALIPAIHADPRVLFPGSKLER
jgi:hypothetical protein